MVALKQAGAEVVMGACNVDSTDDVAAAYATSKGITVYGWRGMSQSEYQENLALVRSFEADYLCDMGGEFCVAYLDKNPPVVGALEATTSGLRSTRCHFRSLTGTASLSKIDWKTGSMLGMGSGMRTAT